MASSRRQDAATALTGAALLGAGGGLRHAGVSQAVGNGQFPRIHLAALKGAKRGPKGLYLAGTGLGLVGAAGLSQGALGLVHRKKVDKADKQPLWREGVTGTGEALRGRADSIKTPTPTKVRASQWAIAGGAGGAGSAVARALLKHRTGKAKALLAPIAGGLAATASIPVSNRVVRRQTKGQYVVTPTGVRRAKDVIRRPSSKAHMVSSRNGPMRGQVVPTDERFSKIAPRVLFHGTDFRTGERIRRGGVKALREGPGKIDAVGSGQRTGNLDDRGRGIYVSTSPDSAAGYSRRQWHGKKGNAVIRLMATGPVRGREGEPGSFIYSHLGEKIQHNQIIDAQVVRSSARDNEDRSYSRAGGADGRRARLFGKSTSYRQQRAAITAAGATPVIGPYAQAHLAGSYAPPGQRHKNAARQFAMGPAAGNVAGVGGAYGAAHLARHSSKVGAKAERAMAWKTKQTDQLRGHVGLKPAKPAAEGTVRHALRNAAEHHPMAKPLVHSRGTMAAAGLGFLATRAVTGTVGTQRAITLNQRDQSRARVGKGIRWKTGVSSILRTPYHEQMAESARIDEAYAGRYDRSMRAHDKPPRWKPSSPSRDIQGENKKALTAANERLSRSTAELAAFRAKNAHILNKRLLESGQTKKDKHTLARTKRTNAALAVTSGTLGLTSLGLLAARKKPLATSVGILASGVGGTNSLIGARVQRREARNIDPVKKAAKTYVVAGTTKHRLIAHPSKLRRMSVKGKAQEQYPYAEELYGDPQSHRFGDQMSKSLPQLPLGNLPRFAMHKTHGRVRILEYHGNDRFTVLDKTDSRRLVHREHLTFVKKSLSKSFVGGGAKRAVDLTMAERAAVRARRGARGPLESRGTSPKDNPVNTLYAGIHQAARGAEKGPKRNVLFASGGFDDESKRMVSNQLPRKIKHPVVVHPGGQLPMNSGVGFTSAGTKRPSHLIIHTNDPSVVTHEYAHARPRRNAHRIASMNPQQRAREEGRADASAMRLHGLHDAKSGDYDLVPRIRRQADAGDARSRAAMSTIHGALKTERDAGIAAGTGGALASNAMSATYHTRAQSREYMGVRARMGKPLGPQEALFGKAFGGRKLPHVPASRRKLKPNDGRSALNDALERLRAEGKMPSKPVQKDIGADHRDLIRRYGDRGPLPKNLHRDEKIRAYEARYAAHGGKKGEKWQHRANVAEGVRNAALGSGTVALAGLAHLKTKRGGRLALKHPHLHNRLDHLALASGAAGGAAELSGEIARDRRASYASSPGGVAASALTRMRANTPGG